MKAAQPPAPSQVLFTQCRTAYFPQPSVARRKSPTRGTINRSTGKHSNPKRRNNSAKVRAANPLAGVISGVQSRLISKTHLSRGKTA